MSDREAGYFRRPPPNGGRLGVGFVDGDFDGAGGAAESATEEATGGGAGAELGGPDAAESAKRIDTSSSKTTTCSFGGLPGATARMRCSLRSRGIDPT